MFAGIPPEVIETGLVAFTTFFAVVGPIDVSAVYAGLTAGMPPTQRRKTAIKGVIIAAIIAHQVRRAFPGMASA